mmetsp:Transcript_16721/g.37687  ORF Transcript_16721/g.37687 Transcript_16721/m.37687 type:complete len:337 (+) Transcript_16721:112-1122(+)|eukprot:CAMPEP_0197905794 /NCGR_PEP_ID=MMETSP1439-20131203/61164_1 /TAXON_ID=66791 /ORGANISM="Gonyaulax spinifera, Strain CCMP409" /LENGTH=336 /DNA_ID=CAMNT_0043527097 /DNA_START=107 /DNA_END=1117 /DNA_ORIENTATION=-
MDFDDLDAEAEARIDAGEEVSGYLKVNGQPPRGTVLEKIKRTKRLPKDGMLPEKSQALLPTHSNFKDIKPKLRLLCFYGAGDNVGSGWAAIAHEVESDAIEVATYEWPGHGIREKEPLQKTLEGLCDDAFDAVKDAMDGGSFAVLGHSIGCLLATAVCERARRELNCEPVYAIMLERGSPNFPVLSSTGQDLLRNHIDEFLALYGVAFVSAIGGEHGRAMWQHDMELENDTREVGWYKYSCPILSVCALRNYAMEMNKDNLDEKSTIFKQTREEKISYFGTSYNFSRDMYEAWAEWTTHNEGATVLYVDADHYGVKSHKEVRRAMWKGLRDIVNKF